MVLYKSVQMYKGSNFFEWFMPEWLRGMTRMTYYNDTKINYTTKELHPHLHRQTLTCTNIINRNNLKIAYNLRKELTYKHK